MRATILWFLFLLTAGCSASTTPNTATHAPASQPVPTQLSLPPNKNCAPSSTLAASQICAGKTSPTIPLGSNNSMNRAAHSSPGPLPTSPPPKPSNSSQFLKQPIRKGSTPKTTTPIAGQAALQLSTLPPLHSNPMASNLTLPSPSPPCATSPTFTWDVSIQKLFTAISIQSATNTIWPNSCANVSSPPTASRKLCRELSLRSPVTAAPLSRSTNISNSPRKKFPIRSPHRRNPSLPARATTRYPNSPPA